MQATPETIAWRIAGGCCAGVWAWLALFRGNFWRLAERLDLTCVQQASCTVAAIIPARNEAEWIGRAVVSLRQQQLAGTLSIFLADDESTDGTGAASRADVVIPTPLRPPDWKGKLWAVHNGIAAAEKLLPDYYLLTDADIEYQSPHVLRALIGRAESGYDLVSVMVQLQCTSRAERLLIPAFVFFFFMLYPPAWVQSRQRRTAASAGGCMLVRREIMQRIGGIQSIRGALIDDCALAAKVKAHGGRVWLGVSDLRVRSMRGYQTLGQIHSMIARSAFAQLRHSGFILAGTVAGLVFTYLLPVLLLFSPDHVTAGFGLAAWATSAAVFAPTVAEYRAPWLTVFALPAVALVYLRATLASAWNYWNGRGGEWKGRVQDGRN